MSRNRLEVADVFRNYGSEFMQQWGSSLSVDQRRAFDAIVNCRTKSLVPQITIAMTPEPDLF